MKEKRKRFDEPDLELRLKTPTQDESINRIPTLDEAVNFELKHGQVDPNMDLKKLRRTISNRLSAQRSRAKQTEYMAELEKKVKDLENIVAWNRSVVENGKETIKKLLLENAMLQAQLGVATHKSNLSTAQTGELMFEIKRLKELAKAQKLEGQSSSSYELGSTAEMDMNQYLNFGSMNFYPPKNGGMDMNQYLNFGAMNFYPPKNGNM